MKISELKTRLIEIEKEHGDIPVMFPDPNGRFGPYEACVAKTEIAEKGQYPDDFNMPEGYKFVCLDVF